jgi:MFS superfamily sulfate permease-like transporter
MTTLLCGYRMDWRKFDVLAGLTTAAVVIPRTMAFAGIVHRRQEEE